MDWSLAANVATTVGAVAGIAGGGFALWTFFHASRTRRAEWLASLHEKFFETDRYAKVRTACWTIVPSRSIRS